jgi:nicotinamidase-related amidase
MSPHLPGEFGLLLPVLLVAALFAGLATPAHAGPAQATVIAVWDSVKAPPVPELASVTVDPKTTALLILDIEERTANLQRRPRAVGSVPAIRNLLERARAAGMPVVYSTTSKGSPEAILPDVAPRPGDPVVKSSVDKFFRTDLEKILRDRGVQRVIVVGTAAEGAVLNTATAAALRSLDVVVPVDGISSAELYAEQYVCWHLMNAPGVSGRVTLTEVARITLGP